MDAIGEMTDANCRELYEDVEITHAKSVIGVPGSGVETAALLQSQTVQSNGYQVLTPHAGEATKPTSDLSIVVNRDSTCMVRGACPFTKRRFGHSREIGSQFHNVNTADRIPTDGSTH